MPAQTGAVGRQKTCLLPHSTTLTLLRCWSAESLVSLRHHRSPRNRGARAWIAQRSTRVYPQHRQDHYIGNHVPTMLAATALRRAASLSASAASSLSASCGATAARSARVAPTLRAGAASQSGEAGEAAESGVRGSGLTELYMRALEPKPTPL